MCMFMVLWSLLVYSPIAHWVWSADRLARRGVSACRCADFAGGTVVHINAGIAGLVVLPRCSASASATATTTWRRTTWPMR